MRCDASKWLRNELPHMRKGTRHGQQRPGTQLRSKRDEVKVERTRLIEDHLRPAAEFHLQCLQLHEQRFRGFIRPRLESNRGIDKSWRTWGTIDRSALP